MTDLIPVTNKDGQVRWLATLNIQQAAAASGLPVTAVRERIAAGRIDVVALDGGHPRIPAVFIHRIANGEL